MPLLRRRPEDILPLAEEFLREVTRGADLKGSRAFTPAARQALMAHSWPGNLRELRNVVERAAILSDRENIIHHLRTEHRVVLGARVVALDLKGGLAVAGDAVEEDRLLGRVVAQEPLGGGQHDRVEQALDARSGPHGFSGGGRPRPPPRLGAVEA